MKGFGTKTVNGSCFLSEPRKVFKQLRRLSKMPAIPTRETGAGTLYAEGQSGLQGNS